MRVLSWKLRAKVRALSRMSFVLSMKRHVGGDVDDVVGVSEEDEEGGDAIRVERSKQRKPYLAYSLT